MSRLHSRFLWRENCPSLQEQQQQQQLNWGRRVRTAGTERVLRPHSISASTVSLSHYLHGNTSTGELKCNWPDSWRTCWSGAIPADSTWPARSSSPSIPETTLIQTRVHLVLRPRQEGRGLAVWWPHLSASLLGSSLGLCSVLCWPGRLTTGFHSSDQFLFVHDLSVRCLTKAGSLFVWHICIKSTNHPQIKKNIY